jgi:FkbH-like protein
MRDIRKSRRRMTLIEALQIANTAQKGPPFEVLLACGCEPLHLLTALKAHLRLALPTRSIVCRTGLYGDLAGTLENARECPHAVLVALEWADLDPRLGWRSVGDVDANVISDARARLHRIENGIAALAEKAPVALSLPALPMPPVFHTRGNELNGIEAALREMVFGLAASTRAVVLHPEMTRQESRHDLRMELMSGFPYRFAYTDALAAGFVRAILPAAPKKGLITDLDETMWSGVLGDDGPDGISWDTEHKTHFHGLYQRLLNRLAEAGVLVGVASKNDAALVRDVFMRSDLVVDPSHLFPIEAHWHPKLQSIERILKAWNIGADSVVFVDDNRLELELVKAAFPSMECLEFRDDDAGFLLDLRDRFGRRKIREEDELRVTSLRRGQALRQAAEDGKDLDALLAGAEASVTFRWGKEPVDPRALELINKTNQFNLNSVRYTEGDWAAYLSEPTTQLVVVEYEDRFGKLGKVAAIAGREYAGTFDVEVWVMSCRAFSRRIEHQCLAMLLNRWDRLTFHWKRGQRNDPMLAFLTEMAPDLRALRRTEFSGRCPPLFHQTKRVGDLPIETECIG